MNVKEIGYTEDNFDFFSELVDFIEKRGITKGIIINTEDIIVSGLTKESCRYCTSYNGNYSCPSFSPEEEEVKNLIEKYRYGMLLVLRVPAPALIVNLPLAGDIFKKLLILKNGRKIHHMILELERQAEGKGFYSDSFIAGKCLLHTKCEKLKAKRCGYPLLRRYSMESAGINVFCLAKKYGIKLKNKLDDEFYYIGLFLANKEYCDRKKVQVVETRMDEEIKWTDEMNDSLKFDINKIKRRLIKKYSNGTLIMAKNVEFDKKGISLNKLVESTRSNHVVADYGYVPFAGCNNNESSFKRILRRFTDYRGKIRKYGVYAFLADV